jgi:hypothetical protein
MCPEVEYTSMRYENTQLSFMWTFVQGPRVGISLFEQMIRFCHGMVYGLVTLGNTKIRNMNNIYYYMLYDTIHTTRDHHLVPVMRIHVHILADLLYGIIMVVAILLYLKCCPSTLFW